MHATFIFGTGQEDNRTIANLAKFAYDTLKVPWASYHSLTPFPGTPYFIESLRNGTLRDFDFSHYDFTRTLLETAALRFSDLDKVRDQLHARLLGRPGLLCDYLKDPDFSTLYLIYISITVQALFRRGLAAIAGKPAGDYSRYKNMVLIRQEKLIREIYGAGR